MENNQTEKKPTEAGTSPKAAPAPTASPQPKPIEQQKQTSYPPKPGYQQPPYPQQPSPQQFYPQQPYGGYSQMYPIYNIPRKPVPVLQLFQIIFSIFGIAAGVLSIILGFTYIYYRGNYAYHKTYNGNFYTDIQNAASDAARNIYRLGYCIENIGQLFFFMLGIILIIVFTKRLFTDIDNFKKASKELEKEMK